MNIYATIKVTEYILVLSTKLIPYLESLFTDPEILIIQSG